MGTRPYVWSFRRCPFAIRARLAIDVAGVDVEYREIKLREKPAEMLAESPKGTVPVCTLPSGQVIDESLDIMRWALAQNDPDGWLARDDDEGISIERWVELGEAFKPHLDRYKYANRFPEDTHAATALACRTHLTKLDEQLRGTVHLVGMRFTLADAALFPFVRQFHFSNTGQLDEWNLDALKRWLELHLASERFARVMVKHEQWTPATPD